jgi:hypothetical protein
MQLPTKSNRFKYTNNNNKNNINNNNNNNNIKKKQLTTYKNIVTAGSRKRIKGMSVDVIGQFHAPIA